ncbi:MAG: hypothetical protein H8E35_14095 [Ardenticatenia bacterium]|nr:hypothetical protein [Ardenticatenia bacterium]
MTTDTEKNMNPFGLCTWDEQSDCENCKDKNLLFCKFDQSILTAFIMLFLPFFVASFFSLVIVGVVTHVWWFLILDIVLFLAIFGFIETGVLCRHCPYYSRPGTNLKCLADNGCFRIWKYNPKPLHKWEQATMYVYYVVLTLISVGGTAYGIWFIASQPQTYGNAALLPMIALLVIIIISIASFLICLKIYVCSRCVNFSCPFNGVEKPVVDEFLRQNPVMREAWEETGYKLG